MSAQPTFNLRFRPRSDIRQCKLVGRNQSLALILVRVVVIVVPGHRARRHVGEQPALQTRRNRRLDRAATHSLSPLGLAATARRLGATPTAVALAWLIGRAAVTSPIASATTQAQLDELLPGAELRLDSEAVNARGHASAPGPA